MHLVSFWRLSIHHRLAFALAVGSLLCGLAGRASLGQPPAATAPDVRAYPTPVGTTNDVAQTLRGQFGQRGDVTIIPDVGRSQLLVSAPAALHAEIGAAVKKAVAATPKPLPVPVAGNSEILRHSLAKTSPLELERSLIAASHGALRFQRSSSGAVDEAELPSAGGATVHLKLDHRARTVELSGEPRLAQGWLDVVRSFDQRPRGQETARMVAVERTEPERMNHALEVIRSIMQANEAARTRRQHIGQFVGMVFQQPEEEARQPRRNRLEAEPLPPEGMPDQPDDAPLEEEEGIGSGPLGNVQIEIVEELGIIIIRGKQKDVDRVMRFIEEIERQSQETQPEIEVYHLQHVDSEALATLLASVYDQVFAVRQGRVTYTPLVKPNALLLIGRKEAMAPLKELIDKLDRPVSPQQLLKVFPLRFVAATDAVTTIQTFFTQQPPNNTNPLAGLGTRVSVVADARTNALIVRASPRDLEEVALLIKQIDVESPAAKDQVRIFKLRNSLADDLSSVLNQAITGQRSSNAPTPGGPGGNQPATSGSASARSRALEFLVSDGSGRQLIESGVLSDVSIVSDPRGNSLIVTAPEKSMPLIAELIRQLDDLPASESQIKVFTIVNGDATSLATMLQQLFGQQQQQNNQAAAALFGLSTGTGDSSLVPLRFSVDQRTNSIIASGSAGDLDVVRRILARLDEGDIRERVTKVYRLQNAPSIDVSNAINQWLQGRRQLAQIEAQTTSPFEQIEREVIVVPEPVSNSLIVSATPRYFSEVQKIVEDLDRRPPMVAIQVLIGEVTLNNTDEFGIELGVQDGALFTRGIGNVGFPFNQVAIGNNSDAASLATRRDLAGQALSNLNVGRTNAAQGFGGLVLSASSESVNILVRALQASQRLQVISRPQVQTLDNQPAFVQVGARVPQVTGSTLTVAGTQNSITLINTGILLGVTPRTSPDGLIVMEINAEKSELGPESTGVPISVNANGQVIRSPQILITTAQTTVSARSGQTVILGGLITKNRDAVTRRVPYIADVPVLGRLFRFDSVIEQRRELLIIMTPYVIRNDQDLDALNQRETERMSWCLSDVVNIHGNVGLGAGANPWKETTTPLIYPDDSPTGVPTVPDPEALPTPRSTLPGAGGPRTTTTPDVYTPPPTRQEPPPPQFQPPQFQPPDAPPPGTDTRYQPSPTQPAQPAAGPSPTSPAGFKFTEPAPAAPMGPPAYTQPTQRPANVPASPPPAAPPPGYLPPPSGPVMPANYVRP
jgi:type II secretory pathway component GspD/PulD (secretin)